MCRLAKAESQNRKRRSEGNVEVRNPSPKIRNGQRKVVAINKSRKGKPEKGIERWCQPTKTGDPKRETDSWSEVRPRKPETDNEVYNVDQRKSETSGSWLQATKPEIRNPKPTAKVDFKRRNPKAETRDPKSETDSESGFQATKLETRNSKAETGSESWLQATKPEPRNPKPETGYKRRKPETRNPKPKPETRNPKPETRNPKPKPETRNPKPETRNPKAETRNRLESDFRGGSPDRNSKWLFPIPWFVACWFPFIPVVVSLSKDKMYSFFVCCRCNAQFGWVAYLYFFSAYIIHLGWVWVGGWVGLITSLLLRTYFIFYTISSYVKIFLSWCYVTRTSLDFMLRYVAFSCASCTTSSYVKISLADATSQELL